MKRYQMGNQKPYIDLDLDLFWFNATFSNISAISWRPVLVVEKAEVPGENHRPWASNSVYRRRTDNVMIKRQTMIYKTLHRKLKDWTTRTPLKPGVKSGDSKNKHTTYFLIWRVRWSRFPKHDMTFLIDIIVTIDAVSFLADTFYTCNIYNYLVNMDFMTVLTNNIAVTHLLDYNNMTNNIELNW